MVERKTCRNKEVRQEKGDSQEAGSGHCDGESGGCTVGYLPEVGDIVDVHQPGGALTVEARGVVYRGRVLSITAGEKYNLGASAYEVGHPRPCDPSKWQRAVFWTGADEVVNDPSPVPFRQSLLWDYRAEARGLSLDPLRESHPALAWLLKGEPDAETLQVAEDWAREWNRASAHGRTLRRIRLGCAVVREEELQRLAGKVGDFIDEIAAGVPRG